METILAKLRASAKTQGGRPCAVLAVYENSATGQRVEECCRSLEQLAGKPCEMVKQMWLVNELRVPQLRAIAAEEAATADLVFISVHPSESLPAEVQSWLELWLGQKDRHSAILMALFDPPYQGDSTSMQLYLQEAAARAKIEFLVRCEEVPENRLRSD